MVVKNYEGTARLVAITKDGISAQFSHIGGEYIGSAFSLLLLNGNHSLKDIRIIDNKATGELIQVGTTISIENIYVE